MELYDSLHDYSLHLLFCFFAFFIMSFHNYEREKKEYLVSCQMAKMGLIGLLLLFTVSAHGAQTPPSHHHDQHNQPRYQLVEEAHIRYTKKPSFQQR